MPASAVTVIQFCDLIEDLIDLGGNRNLDIWPERIRQIEGSQSVKVSMEAVAKELERRWGLGQ